MRDSYKKNNDPTPSHVRLYPRGAFCLFMLTALLFSCSGQDGNYAQYGGSFFMPPPDVDTLVLYDINDPPTLDPARSWGTFDGLLVSQIFSNLVRFNQKAEIEPDLALRWEMSDGARCYTFFLNPQAKFSNGRSVTAEDVRYSFERVLDKDTASSSRWVLERIETIRAEDPLTVVLTLKEPFAPFLGLLAMPAASIVPREEVERCEREGIPFGERPVGSGPWLFKEWRHDQYLDFERNEEYWGQKPNLKRLRMRIISNAFTAIAEFETGRIAYINPLPEAEILRWKTHPQWKKYTELTNQLSADMLVFNCERAPWDKEENRRALCQAVETPLVLECVREGAGAVITGPIPPGLPGFDPDRKLFKYDPDASRELVKQNGLDKREIVLLLPSSDQFVSSTGVIMQALWKKIGVSVRVHQAEWVTYRRMLREGEFDIAYRNWFADYPDGDNFLYPLFHSSQIGSGNMARFADPEVDRLIEESQKEMNPSRRSELLTQANALVYEKAPALFLWSRAKYIVTQPWLKEYTEPLIFNGTQFLAERIEAPAVDLKHKED